MRVEYEVDKDKMNKFLDYFYTTNKLLIDDYFVVAFGYIIDNNLVNYPFDTLRDLCEGNVRDKSPIISDVEDLDKFYWKLSPKAPLTNKSIRWIKIGVDFMLTNCKEHMLIEVLRGDKIITYNQENKVIKEYVIENKEEFPDAYLELML